MKHIKGLDTLRAFAVIFVIIQHWGPPFNYKSPLGHFVVWILLPNGSDSVYVFFVLSGFLITSILLNARIENKEANRLLIVKNFIIRRAFRIFPIYYLTVFILYYFYDNVKDNIWYLLTYTLNIISYNKNSFISDFAHSWTLSIEEQFYLVWPWLILFINRKYLKYLFAGAIFIGIVSSYITLGITHHIDPFPVYNCLDSFGFGGLYAYVLLNAADSKKFEKVIKLIVPVFISTHLYWNIAGYVNQPQYGMWMLKTVDSITAVWLIILITNNKSLFLKKYLLENKVLNFIGKISYGIYICHPFIVRVDGPFKAFIDDRIVYNPFWHDFLTNDYFFYALDLALLIFVCWLSYTFIEMPILSLKRFFKYNQRPD